MTWATTVRVACAPNAGPTQTIVPFAYDKRQKDARGLSLAAPFPELKLIAGDRFGTCLDLPDVGAFFRISSFPPDGVAVDSLNGTLCLHRCPLFNRDIGLTPNTAVALDLRHTYHLGVTLVYCRHDVWECLRSGVWEWLRQTERRTSKTLFPVFGPSCGLGMRQGGSGTLTRT